MNKMLDIIRKTRATLMKKTYPIDKYWLATKSTTPISDKFGYDRGTPIDRYWIETFLAKNSNLIQGTVLEITDNAYSNKYGGDKVTKSDVLDIDKNNKKATVYGDLRNLQNTINDTTYDCIILTHVLGLIDDVEAAVSELHRILKPNGVLLLTSSCISPAYELNTNFWRFTANGAKYLFSKRFTAANLKIESLGNVLTGQCFWVGVAQEELTKEQLEYNDPKFPCVITIIAKKGAQPNE